MYVHTDAWLGQAFKRGCHLYRAYTYSEKGNMSMAMTLYIEAHCYVHSDSYSELSVHACCRISQ